MDPVTIYGAVAVTLMMLMYALARRDPRFILGFAFGCVLASVYGFLSGAWPFGFADARPESAEGPPVRAFGAVR